MRMTSQFSEMTSSAIFFDVVLFLLWSLVSYQYHWSRFHAIIITGSGVMIICFYKGLARNSEIGNTPSEFCSISGDCGNEKIPNLERTSLIKCYWMLQNAWVRTFTISELLRENQLGEGVNLPPTQPPAQIRVKHIAFFSMGIQKPNSNEFQKDGRRKGSKTMKRSILLWNKSYATIVLPNIKIQNWFYMLRSVFLYVQEHFLKRERQQLCCEKFETFLSGSETKDERF